MMRQLRHVPQLLLCAAVLLVLALATIAHAQSFLRHFLSVASSTQATLVHAGPTYVSVIHGGNTTAGTVFLKLMNSATLPTCGTTPVVATFPIPPLPASGTAPPLVVAGEPFSFPLGLAFCVTGALPDNDTTTIGTGVVVNFGLSGGF